MQPTSDKVPTDLHGHTHLSDGRTTPEEYVRFRAEIGLEVIALSDHDTFLGVARASAEAKKRGITLVPAMEASSFIHFGTDAAEQIHVLAYFPPAFLEDGRLEKTFLAARARRLQERWRTFVMEWVDGRSAEERATFDPGGDLETKAPNEFPGLQSVIDMLVWNRQKELFRAFHAHHVRFWTDDRELFGWTPEVLIDQIRADGGFDVVAHPNRVRDKERMEKVLEYVNGVEVYSSRHNEKVSERFLDYATTHGKHWTASTDDHQHTDYVRPADGTPRRTVERILGGA